jgi:hypothetical protein
MFSSNHSNYRRSDDKEHERNAADNDDLKTRVGLVVTFDARLAYEVSVFCLAHICCVCRRPAEVNALNATRAAAIVSVVNGTTPEPLLEVLRSFHSPLSALPHG